MPRIPSRVMSILFLVFSSWGGLFAATGGAGTLQVELGFGGYVVPERWAPLRVSAGVEVPGGRIEVLRLAADGSKAVSEYFPYIPGLPVECPVMMDSAASMVRVRLCTGASAGTSAGANALILAEANLETKPKAFPGHIALLVGMDAQARRAVAEALQPIEPIMAISLTPDLLPVNPLSLDSVSAVILRDSGGGLSPGQRDALAAWLSGGGRLVVFDARSDGEGFLASFEPARGLSLSEDTAFASSARASGARAANVAMATNFGRGSLAVYGGEPPGAEDAAWKDIVGLAPYEKNERLAAGRIFAAVDNPQPSRLDPLKVEPPLVLAIGVWAALALILGRFCRRRVFLLAAFSLAACAAALIGGSVLRSERPAAARAHARLFVLPGSRSAIAQVGVLPARLESFTALEKALPSLEVSFNYSDLERGRIEADGDLSWSHLSSRPAFTVRRSTALGGASGLILEALLPGEALAGSRVLKLLEELGAEAAQAPAGDLESPPSLSAVSRAGRLAWVVVRPETSWWECGGPDGGWVRRDRFPQWLAGDAAWVLRACGELSASGFLIGIEELPAFDLSLGAAALREVTWIVPFGPGGGEAAR